MIGETFAFFHSQGSFPKASEQLNNLKIDGTIEEDASQSKRAVTPSGLHALLVFKPSKIFITSDF